MDNKNPTTDRTPWAVSSSLLKDYYDTEWGLPITDEAGLFERLSLEAFQAGLSWAVVLKKRPAFREAFCHFDPEKIADFGEPEVERLLADTTIIRNETKIRATVNNAKATIELRKSGGLANFIWSFQPAENIYPEVMEDIPKKSPESQAMSRELKKAGFKFVGPVTCFALMEAIGMVDTHLLGSHRRASSGVWPEETKKLQAARVQQAN
ncbi:DNA-3-methyladenine glycosylase I [Corynebacterium macginleyi]|uniref:DNA-3-methyladenine glycosylase I n=1 Tax=Corynebacterium macginleyi TaxID=38290 RepID=UPI00190D358D|nr:DNA-3-methyladenine glycosylase I [Corynebacterium macginleyi]MBK4138306.1 DNA-3-methyladenine glycosylase I [Corynebacterium macginleyi]